MYKLWSLDIAWNGQNEQNRHIFNIVIYLEIGLGLFQIAIFHIAIFQIVIFHIAIFQIAIFHIAIFQIAIFQIVIFHIAIFQIAIFHIAIFHIVITLSTLIQSTSNYYHKVLASLFIYIYRVNALLSLSYCPFIIGNMMFLHMFYILMSIVKQSICESLSKMLRPIGV